MKRVPKEEKGKNREPEEKESEGKQEGKVRNKLNFSGIFFFVFGVLFIDGCLAILFISNFSL